MDPQKVTLHHLGLRLTINKNTKKDKLIKLLHTAKKYFLVLENPDSNAHYQAYLQIETKKPVLSKSVIDNFRRELKKNQDLTGNKSYAVTPITETPEKYLLYLCKEDNIIENNILLENEIALNRVAYWKENKRLKAQNGNKKWFKIKEQKIDEKWNDKDPCIIWGIKIIMYHDENKLLIPDDYSLKKMIKTYTFADLDDDKKEKYAYNRIKAILEYENLGP